MTRNVALSPECALVFLTAGDHAREDEIRALVRGPLDWGRVLVIAEREHAIAGLGRVISRLPNGAVPAEVAEYVRRQTMVSDFRMLHLQQYLARALAALADRGVEAMLLKGAAFGASVYDSFADRPMVDVDVLVRKEDVVRARSAIVGAGWQADVDPVLADLLSDHHHLPPFLDPNGLGLRLELHTSLLPPGHPFAIEESEVWHEASRADARFSGALIPSPRHLLYHAGVHFAWAHAMQFGAWRTFRDIGALIRSTAIDWEEFVAFAKLGRAASACAWMLRLSQRLSATPVPPGVVARLRAPTPEIVQRAIERHFLATIAPGEGPPCPSTLVAQMLWRLAIRPSWSGHGGRAPWDGAKDWQAARTGVLPQRGFARAARHIVGARQWWDYAVHTLIPLGRQPSPARRLGD